MLIVNIYFWVNWEQTSYRNIVVLEVQGVWRARFERMAEKILAYEVVKDIHGVEEAENAKKISEELRVQYKIHNVDQVSLNQGASILKNQKATAGVFLVSDESLPMLVTVPDQRYAFINTSLISNLSENKIQTCIARALCLICGAGNRASTGHLLSPISDEKDFDKIQLKHIPGDVLLTVQGFLRDSGIKTFQVRTYRQACAEGWAPQPSNEWQKAIWDKVHATPKNPMKIEFDPKKGR